MQTDVLGIKTEVRILKAKVCVIKKMMGDLYTFEANQEVASFGSGL